MKAWADSLDPGRKSGVSSSQEKDKSISSFILFFPHEHIQETFAHRALAAPQLTLLP